MQDGRILPENYKQFTHGYAVTAHRSQGKSVDAVVVSADGMRKELFYVAASRGRDSITVVTSDKELLRESVARSEARQSASELSRKTQASSLGPLRLSLRQREAGKGQFVRNQSRHNVSEGKGFLREAPVPETAQLIDRQKPSSQPKRDNFIEPGHYLASAVESKPGNGDDVTTWRRTRLRPAELEGKNRLQHRAVRKEKLRLRRFLPSWNLPAPESFRLRVSI